MLSGRAQSCSAATYILCEATGAEPGHLCTATTRWQLPACLPGRAFTCSAEQHERRLCSGVLASLRHRGFLVTSPKLLLVASRRGGEAGREEKPQAASNSESGNAEAAPEAAQPPAEEPLAPQPTPVEPVPEVAGASKPVEETLQVCSTVALFWIRGRLLRTPAQIPTVHLSTTFWPSRIVMTGIITYCCVNAGGRGAAVQVVDSRGQLVL
jgi:hypothetical protein